MNEFDQIIGYESEKKVLMQLADVLKNTAKYKAKGVELPGGLLLHSNPGTGKSLMAKCLMKASGRSQFIFCKSDSDDNAIEELKQAYKEASEATPSILLLEDLHLYGPQPYSPIYPTIQSLIDESRIKGIDIFFIGTVNSINTIPESLLRPLRFDYNIKLSNPDMETAEKIIRYYLKGRKLASDASSKDLVKALHGGSCATLESVMNVATLNSVYYGHSAITKSDIIEGILQIVHSLHLDNSALTPEELEQVAYHEAAGHALVSEILRPGNVSMITLASSMDGRIGMTDYANSTGYSTCEEILNRATTDLAGKAAVDVFYGRSDVGVKEDIQLAMEHIRMAVSWLASSGFTALDYENRNISEERNTHIEKLVSAKMEELYQKAKQIIKENEATAVALQKALLKQKTLLSSDIQHIMRETSKR